MTRYAGFRVLTDGQVSEDAVAVPEDWVVGVEGGVRPARCGRRGRAGQVEGKATLGASDVGDDVDHCLIRGAELDEESGCCLGQLGDGSRSVEVENDDRWCGLTGAMGIQD